jgi:hypothetical protein
MYMFQGVAFDPAAHGASGVDRVAIFLDPRDQGGQYLGDAMLGPNVRHLITVYAHSSVTGQETSRSVPITID